MARHLQAPGLRARRAHRHPVEELRPFLHGRTGDLDGRRHHGGDLPHRDRRDRALRAGRQRGQPAVRRQAGHLAAAGERGSRRHAVHRLSAGTGHAVRKLGRHRGAHRAAGRPAAALARRPRDADLHLGLHRPAQGRDAAVQRRHPGQRGDGELPEGHLRREPGEPPAVLPAAGAQFRARLDRVRVAGRRHGAHFLCRVAGHLPGRPAAGASHHLHLGAAALAQVPAGRVRQDAAAKTRSAAAHPDRRAPRRPQGAQGPGPGPGEAGRAAARRRSRPN